MDTQRNFLSALVTFAAPMPVIHRIQAHEFPDYVGKIVSVETNFEKLTVTKDAGAFGLARTREGIYINADWNAREPNDEDYRVLFVWGRTAGQLEQVGPNLFYIHQIPRILGNYEIEEKASSMIPHTIPIYNKFQEMEPFWCLTQI